MRKLLKNLKCYLLDRYASLKLEEVFANMTEAISKVGPFRTWILTPASSVWIQLVSLNGMFVTGMLLFLYLFNLVAKFSWNYFEVAFCCAMSFGYFACGLHLILKGSKICPKYYRNYSQLEMSFVCFVQVWPKKLHFKAKIQIFLTFFFPANAKMY